MSAMEKFLKFPHAIIALALVGVVAGLLAYTTLPMNLFPNTNRPMIAVVTQWPGAAANDVATDVTHPIEVRLSSIDGVRRVTSTSKDQVSAVQVEFEYDNDIDTAANKVTTELRRVKSMLPPGTYDSLIFKITDAAQPLMVLSLTPTTGTKLSSGQIRRLAENQLRDALLAIPGVAEAEIFGGDRREISVSLDRNQLEAHGITVAEVADALIGTNVSIPTGLVHHRNNRYLLTAEALSRSPEDIAAIMVAVSKGSYVRVGDLGTVIWGKADATSLYRGNGKPAVAVSLLRSENGHAREVISEIQKMLPSIKAEFPMLNIDITDTQGRLIDLTVDNMLSALRDAVIMTLCVILLFLGNTRASFITALSLPFTYVLTFASMKFLGFEFNMVTLTGIIIAVGLLTDDAIVVIENIERHIRETGKGGIKVAARGTSEILLADTAGTLSVIIVLMPIMFIGGYVQTVLRPLTVVLAVALASSLIVSITIIPLLVPWLLKPGAADPIARLLSPFERFILEPLKKGYVAMVDWGLQHRLLVLLVLAGLFIFSARQMPLLGRELMPLMDTGVISVDFEAQPNTDDSEMMQLAEKVEHEIKNEIPEKWLLTMSTIIGSEPGVKSFGASRLLQQGKITVNMIDRFHRNRAISDIENGIRTRLKKIPGLISSNVTEFGATPLSSIRATVDVMITGPDISVLDKIADEVLIRFKNVKGLTGTERTWQGMSQRINLNVDPAKARLFGLTARDVAHQVAFSVGGLPGGGLRITGENPIPIRVRLNPSQRSDPEQLLALPVRTKKGKIIPLSSVARLEVAYVPTAETHQGLLPTIDVLGYRRNIAVTHLHENVKAALADLVLPRGYHISYEGEIKPMDESFMRLAKSLALGLAFLFLMLAIAFKSFLDPLAIMVSLPLAVIGAAWAMMLAGKHGCLPSFMGFILLMGIVVNNGILLVDFTKIGLRQGKDLREALLDAVRHRTRPILMTAGASAVGMIPIALEWAVGIERLSPMAVVIIGGLIVGTFLTLLVVPVLFHLLESGKQQFLSWYHGGPS
ncbi:MAG: AcrB/AcrD/AcrF family protein [Deltaproteobacteria bacterium]|nr:MAG: AcrB/AcrD/AcrF family protein [Deltaproteobacteria bacterium]